VLIWKGELEDFRIGEDILDVGFIARSFVWLAGCGVYCLRLGKRSCWIQSMEFLSGSALCRLCVR
jgi:hypothetical protein